MTDAIKYDILIVDDDESNLDTLSKMLKSTYNLQLAKTGESALEQAREGLPDLILLGLLLPDMSGFDVLTELKASVLTRDIPVIIISSLDNIENEEKGLFMGAVDYIGKPYHQSIVKARIRTHLQIVKQLMLIERYCLIDVLTDTANRSGFEKLLYSEWRRAIRENEDISLLMIDIDRFREYNLLYGHQQGDNMLREVARTISGCVKRSTDLVARYMGEKFAVILPSTDRNGAGNIAETVRSSVEKMVVLSALTDMPTSITVSVGIATIKPILDDDSDEFLGEAEAALHEAKKGGGNIVR